MNSINIHAHKSPISFRFNKQIGLKNLIFPQNGVNFVDFNPSPHSQFGGCHDLDWPLPLTWRKDVLKFSIRRANSDGARPLQPGRPEKEDESETSLSADDMLTKSAKQEKITALFRQILSSISKAEAKRARLTKDNLSQKSPPEPTPKFHQQSKRRIKATAKRGKGDQVLPQKHVPCNDKMQEKTQCSAASFIVTRQPSNFVRKSPIPSINCKWKSN